MHQAPEEGGRYANEAKGTADGMLPPGSCPGAPAGARPGTTPEADRESQAAEDIRLTRLMINNERQALVTKGWISPRRDAALGPLPEYRSEAKKVGIGARSFSPHMLIITRI